jgi:hypothetical protein
MVVRKKNLLDAFQASAPEGRTAAGRRSTQPTSAGGPFAPVGAARGPLGEGGAKGVAHWPTGARVPVWRRWLADRAVRVALIVGLLCLGVAYWAGRQHEPALEAGPSSPASTAPSNAGALLRSGAEAPPAPAETELAKHNLATAQAGSTHDQQFMNPVNKYTVRVKTFGNDASGLAAARALHDYFVKEDLPVILPISQGQSCIVYVGHADKKKDADLLAKYIQRMRGPGPSGKAAAFDDAYVVNIDSVVKR